MSLALSAGTAARDRSRERRRRRFRAGFLVVLGSSLVAGCSSGSSPGDLLQDHDGHTATLLESGEVLVVGGYGGSNVGTASNELYDPATGWSAASDSVHQRQNHTATLLVDGRVLAVGGVGGVGATAEIYDPRSGTWALTPLMLTDRNRHTATVLIDGRVLVAGGEGDDFTSGPSRSAELYDPATNSWSEAAQLSEGRAGHTATLLADGRVLVVGGGTPVPGPESDSFTSSPVATAEVYDPDRHMWSSAGSTLQARESHTATLLEDGRVLVVGGHDPVLDQALTSAELYDPATGSWSSARPLENRRAGHTATLLVDGRVLVAGGQDDENRQKQRAEIYDAATDTWSPAGEMRKGRHGHTATLLDDGNVLIAGGSGEGGERPRLTEIFDPVTNTWRAAAGQR